MLHFHFKIRLHSLWLNAKPSIHIYYFVLIKSCLKLFLFYWFLYRDEVLQVSVFRPLWLQEYNDLVVLLALYIPTTPSRNCPSSQNLKFCNQRFQYMFVFFLLFVVLFLAALVMVIAMFFICRLHSSIKGLMSWCIMKHFLL